MLPITLESRVDDIFAELGGLSYAKQVFTDEQLIDICLFNGYTDTVFPNYKEFASTLEKDVYSYVNLTLIDYKPGTYITILDSNNNSLFTTKPQSYNIYDEQAYVFGIANAEKDFLRSREESELIYILYESFNTVLLAQLIVSFKIPQTIIKSNIDSWSAALAKLQTSSISYRELNINTKDIAGVMLYKLDGELSDQYTEEDLVYSKESTAYELNLGLSYTRFQSNAWITLRRYFDYSDYAIEFIEDKDLMHQQLIALTYNKVDNQSNRNIYHKDIGEGEIAEVIVTTINDITTQLDISKFNRLALTNIDSDINQSLTAINNIYFLNAKQSHMPIKLQNKANKAQVISQSSFKINAEVSYV